MSEMSGSRYLTAWDFVIGALLFVAGIVLLANAAFATKVSVLFIGWLVFAAGVFGLVAAMFRIGKSGFWSAAVGGGLLAVLGLAVLRNTDAAAVTLTLVAGAMFLVSGILRLTASAQEPEDRIALVIAGVLSTALGLIVLFNLFDASYVLLGVLLGIQVMIDGLAMMVIGRWHPAKASPPHGAAIVH